jgi:hypothetical protein
MISSCKCCLCFSASVYFQVEKPENIQKNDFFVKKMQKYAILSWNGVSRQHTQFYNSLWDKDLARSGCPAHVLIV